VTIEVVDLEVQGEMIVMIDRRDDRDNFRRDDRDDRPIRRDDRDDRSFRRDDRDDRSFRRDDRDDRSFRRDDRDDRPIRRDDRDDRSFRGGDRGDRPLRRDMDRDRSRDKLGDIRRRDEPRRDGPRDGPRDGNYGRRDFGNRDMDRAPLRSRENREPIGKRLNDDGNRNVTEKIPDRSIFGANKKVDKQENDVVEHDDDGEGWNVVS